MSEPGDRYNQHMPEQGEATPIDEQPQTVRVQIPLFPDRSWRVILGILVAVYALEVVRSGGLTPDLQTLFDLGAKYNPAILQGGEYWRLFTAMFLHGSVLHILFNGYSLFAIGPTVERFFGTARFLGVYFIAGLCGSVASYALSPALSVGASGAIFGMVGALVAFFYLSRHVFGEMARQQLGSLITVIMLNLFIGFGGGNIDNFAHLGGLFGGAVVGWLLAPRYAMDNRTYPPVMTRSFLQLGWAGALAVLLVLAGLTLFVIQPPMPS